MVLDEAALTLFLILAATGAAVLMAVAPPPFFFILGVGRIIAILFRPFKEEDGFKIVTAVFAIVFAVAVVALSAAACTASGTEVLFALFAAAEEVDGSLKRALIA